MTQNLIMESFNHSKHPTDENAFLLNHDSHWVALRKIKGYWYNLNSLAERPFWIEDSKLPTYLYNVRSQGYKVFVVTGEFLDIEHDGEVTDYQFLFPGSYIRNNHIEDC